jgi:Family of unknown function (DUF5677)
VPDLPTRTRVRRKVHNLAAVGPWPGAEAKGSDAARLALLRLLWLQRQVRRAVRNRQREAATVLARASIETLIVGLWCLHNEQAVSELDAASIKALRDMLTFLSREEIFPGQASFLPERVLNECIARLGQPAAAPTFEAMARQVDKAMGGSGALSLYDRYYRPTSTLAVHATAAALMRHVRSDGKVAARPGRAWTSRSPARIADASVGILAHNIARGGPEARLFAAYARRHMERALVPLAVVGAMSLATSVPIAQVFRMFAAAVSLGRYIWSGRAAADPPDVRTTRIRRAYSEALDLAGVDVPAGALDPFIDHVTAMLAANAVDFAQHDGQAGRSGP